MFGPLGALKTIVGEAKKMPDGQKAIAESATLRIPAEKRLGWKGPASTPPKSKTR